MIDLYSLLPLLQCPQCHDSKLSVEDNSWELLCNTCATRYPVTHGRPVLLRHDNAVFCSEDYRRAALPSFDVPVASLRRFIPAPSVNLASERELTRMRQLLADLPLATVLVVGGGRQRQWLDRRLGAGDTVRVVYSDIDSNADVDLFCDGHDLPFAGCVFDAVVTTAVLEHVLYPERVAAEIHRVLRVGGLLYSELPFMQQVHEGAYDFTRYTLSGHRRLFNGFTEIQAGMVAGPGTALVWSIENFVLAFIANPVLRNASKALVRLGFAWLKNFDRMLQKRPEALDGASCTYFFGQKIDGKLDDVDIIARYVGAKHLRHT
jgi:SAM-dependent methyltransferase